MPGRHGCRRARQKSFPDQAHIDRAAGLHRDDRISKAGKPPGENVAGAKRCLSVYNRVFGITIEITAEPPGLVSWPGSALDMVVAAAGKVTESRSCALRGPTVGVGYRHLAVDVYGEDFSIACGSIQ